MPPRRRSVVVGALALALVGLAAAPGAAAEVGPLSSSQCGTSQFCVWSGAAYTGTEVGTSSTSPVSVPFATTQSVWNRSSYAARVYAGSGGTGTSVCYAPGSQVASVHVASASIRVLTTTSC